MCSICHSVPCVNGCPNALDPVPVMYCSMCGEPLYSGDKEYDGTCEECLKDMSVAEILSLFGEKLNTL